MFPHLAWEWGPLLLLLLTSALAGKSIIVEEGQDANLPCTYSSSSLVPVCWGRGPCPLLGCHNEVLNTDGKYVEHQSSNRYKLKGNISGGDVTLTIESVVVTDSGTYCCRIKIPGLWNDKKVELNLTVQPAKVSTAPATTGTTRGMSTIQRYNSENQTQEKPRDEYQTVIQGHFLTTEVPDADSWMGVVYIGAGVFGGLLMLLITGIFICKCYYHRKEKLQNSSLITSANNVPSGLVNMAAQGIRSEENIYIIEENAYEMEDPYRYYCSVIPERRS